MPVLGQRKNAMIGGSRVSKDPMYALAKQFTEVTNSILNESGVDLYGNPAQALNIPASRDALKEFYVNESAPECDFEDMEDREIHEEEMSALFENNREAILENAVAGTYSPVVGMAFPLHKNLLMNTVFDKAMPKTVTVAPIWTMTMETRILQTPDGEEIDIWKQQNKIYEAMESVAPFKQVAMKLPEVEQTDILKDVFKATARHDALGIDTHIDAVAVETWVATGGLKLNADTLQEETVTADPGEKALTWVPVKLNFSPAYGEYNRTLTQKVQIPVSEDGTTYTELTTVISGYMKDNKFGIFAGDTKIVAVRMAAKIDTSSAMVKTCQVKWKTTTTSEEMPNANPINVTLSPEEVKDVAALYNVNQATKVMSIIQAVLGNYRDDKIHNYLDNSFLRLPDEARISSAFDFAPRESYYATHVEWREKTFMDYLDTIATSMLQVLNDPNMTISVVGRADLIRKITPTTTYTTTQTPTNVGPITLDYLKTVVSSENRVYQFISSDKLRGNDNLIILLKPRNTNRILYQVVDYQFYLSNEIRNSENYALPAIHSFDRFKVQEYQPVQGRVKILNPTGLKTPVTNDDPIGVNTMNDAMGLNAPFIKP